MNNKIDRIDIYGFVLMVLVIGLFTVMGVCRHIDKESDRDFQIRKFKIEQETNKDCEC